MKLTEAQRDRLKQLEAKRQLTPYDQGAARALRQVARSGQADNDTVERVDRLLAKPAQATAEAAAHAAAIAAVNRRFDQAGL